MKVIYYSCSQKKISIQTSSIILIGMHWLVVTFHASFHVWHIHECGALNRVIITLHATIKMHIKAYSIICITSIMSHPHMKTIIVTAINYSTLVNRISTKYSLVDLDRRFSVKPQQQIYFSFESWQKIPWLITTIDFPIGLDKRCFPTKSR